MSMSAVSSSVKPVAVPAAEVAQAPAKLAPAQRKELEDAQGMTAAAGLFSGACSVAAITYLAAGSAATNPLAVAIGLGLTCGAALAGAGVAIGASQVAKLSAGAGKARQWVATGFGALSGLAAGVGAASGLYVMMLQGHEIALSQAPFGVPALITATAGVATAVAAYGVSSLALRKL